MIESFPFNQSPERKKPEKQKVPLKDKIEELLREEIEKEKRGDRTVGHALRLSLLQSLSTADDPEKFIRDKLSKIEAPGKIKTYKDNVSETLLKKILQESETGLQKKVESETSAETSLNDRIKNSLNDRINNKIKELLEDEERKKEWERNRFDKARFSLLRSLSEADNYEEVIRNRLSELQQLKLRRGFLTTEQQIQQELLEKILKESEVELKESVEEKQKSQAILETVEGSEKPSERESVLEVRQAFSESEIKATQGQPVESGSAIEGEQAEPTLESQLGVQATIEASSTEGPEKTPEGQSILEVSPPPSLDRIKLEDVLDVKFHQERLRLARLVLDERERVYLREIRSKERCYQEKDNTGKQKCLADAKMRIENALIAVKEARDNYKFSLYYSHFNEKAQEVMYRLWENRLVKEGRLPETEKEKQELWQKERNDFIKNNRDLIENNLFTPQERNLILSSIAWEMLQRHENLYMQEKNIEEEIRKSNNWLARIMERYRSLPYASKVLIGATIAGVSAGALGVAGGAGFAALGIGAFAALRRFIGGFFVGGPIKSLSELIIGRKERKERKEIEKTRESGVQKAIQTVEEALENSELIENYERKVLDAMKHLDKRLDQIVRDSENIRSKSDRRRRLWTAIAILSGGLTSNIDNILELFKGAKGVVEEMILSKVQVSKEVVTTSPETVMLTHPESIVEMSRETLNGVKVGKGGFWEAAKSLKQTLGLDDRTFESAWRNSVVQTPKGTLPLSEAHYVVGDATLSYDIKENVFRVTTTSKTKIDNLFDLINAYKRLGKPIPTWILKGVNR